MNNERVKARWNLEEPTDFDDEPLERSPVEQHGGQETEVQVHIVLLNSSTLCTRLMSVKFQKCTSCKLGLSCGTRMYCTVQYILSRYWLWLMLSLKLGTYLAILLQHKGHCAWQNVRTGTAETYSLCTEQHFDQTLWKHFHHGGWQHD